MKKRPPLLLLVRRTHLFLALFLTPWVLMYALSSIGMHHRMLFTGHEKRVHPGYELISEQKYTHRFEADTDKWTAARLILRDLDLEGAFSVRGTVEMGTLTIIRDHPIRPYQIIYDAGEASVRIEQQKFGMTFFLEMLHRRRGFQQPYVINDLWAVVVDMVIISILLWAFTGVWMWWSIARARKTGTWCLGIGIALFLCFLFIL